MFLIDLDDTAVFSCQVLTQLADITPKWETAMEYYLRTLFTNCNIDVTTLRAETKDWAAQHGSLASFEAVLRQVMGPLEDKLLFERGCS